MEQDLKRAEFTAHLALWQRKISGISISHGSREAKLRLLHGTNATRNNAAISYWVYVLLDRFTGTQGRE